MRVFMFTLGCKLNQSESDAMARRLAMAGHWVVPQAQAQAADAYLVNTCTVTHIAARKSRQAIRRLHRLNPLAPILVTGCHAELTPEEVTSIEGVSLVFGNEGKGRVEEFLSLVAPEPSIPGTGDYHPPRTRAFVKVQDGCDGACAYCVVVLARGPARSRPLEEVIAEIQQRAREGVKEAVLTGVHLGGYGRDLGEGQNLEELIDFILARTPVLRVRLSSLEPWELRGRWLALWDNPRLCPHLHLPLQSGSNAVLARMDRRYSATDYAGVVELARQAIPDLALTTDVMVGFPGESQAEFAESLRFVQEMSFARIHIFPYSRRPGTRASHLAGQVAEPLKRARAKRMEVLARESQAAFQRRFLGREMEVLWESERNGLWSGLTGNYLRVLTRSTTPLANTITPARLERVQGDALWAKIPDVSGTGRG